MGYSLRIRPRDNFQKFRATPDIFRFNRNAEKHILYRVMTFCQNDPNKVNDAILNDFIFRLERYVGELADYYVHERQVQLTKQFDTSDGNYRDQGELVFCGWEYSNMEEPDIEDTRTYIINQLFTIATMTKPYDYYENNEMFSNKQEDINGLFEYLRDECEKAVDYAVITAYPIEDKPAEETEMAPESVYVEMPSDSYSATVDKVSQLPEDVLEEDCKTIEVTVSARDDADVTCKNQE